MKKKLYIQPNTIFALCMPQGNVLLLGSGSGPQPGTAPARMSGEGPAKKINVMYI